MALLYVRTHSLWVPIVAHSLNNLLSILPELLWPTAPAAADELQTFQQSGWVGVVFVVLSLPTLAHFIYRSWPTPGTQPPYFVNTRRHF
jgi:membrane protease YdiL (CAAX protease family)